MIFLEEQLEIADLLREICYFTKVERVMLLKLTNGADKVLEGRRLRYTATGLIDFNQDIKKTSFKRYSGILVDDHYKSIVDYAYANPYTEFITQNEEDSLLKDIYLREDIGYSRIYFLKKIKGVVYYCSFSGSKNWSGDPKTEEFIEIAVGKIRKLYNKIFF